ncbi:MAG TPA: ABC transporter permease [Dehalococcoidia bacterium]|nr:ABC transporter permease [Dehalococcoidia bacterium]
MGGYIANRIAQSIVNMLFITVLVFLLARATGDPAAVFIDDSLPPETAQAFRVKLGLDQPIYVQYWVFLKDLARGDLGQSVKGHRPVTQMLVERLPATFSLGLVAMGIAMVMGIPLGVLSAVYRGTVIDRAAKIVAFLGQSTPSFWLGIMLILFFGVFLFQQGLPSLPISGRGGPATYILPAFTMGWFVVAGLVRLTRSSMLDVLDSDYVTMARAKGLNEKIVIWKHALRNAMIPVLTYSGLILGGFMNGSVVVEQVFAWPGVGRMALTAVSGRDFPVVQGVVIMIGLFYIVINLLVDILYVLVDPRIKYASS